jgi:general secretion pathway protein K
MNPSAVSVHARTHHGRRQNQQGVALITALLVLALAGMLAYAMIEDSARMIARLGASEQAAQASALADGLYDYALIALQKEQQEGGGSDTLDDPWAAALPIFPIPGGTLGGKLEDLNGRINLNALARTGAGKASTQLRLERLLSALKLDPGLAQRISDAIDPDNDSQGAGGEDAGLMAQTPPLRAPNRKLAHVAEIAPIIGDEAYARLAPYVCAISKNAPLNVNTASAQVLQSLSPAMTPELAKRMYADGHAHYSDISSFVTALAQASVVLDDAQQRDLGVSSTHFLARATVNLQNEAYPFTALLERSPTILAVRWRARGSFD